MGLSFRLFWKTFLDSWNHFSFIIKRLLGCALPCPSLLPPFPPPALSSSATFMLKWREVDQWRGKDLAIWLEDRLLIKPPHVKFFPGSSPIGPLFSPFLFPIPCWQVVRAWTLSGWAQSILKTHFQHKQVLVHCGQQQARLHP